MLKINDIDNIKYALDFSTDEVYIYYIAHKVELRESYKDELSYKSDADFVVLKEKVGNIHNAYFDLLEYQKHPENYHIEEETEIMDYDMMYIRLYTVPNHEPQYTKDFNPRIPSAIFGQHRRVFKNDKLVKEYDDPSPILPIYTNHLTFNNLPNERVMDLFEQGKLDWKYQKLDEPVRVDGIDFNYVTSDYYIIELPQFPRIEHHMINVKEKTAFFMTTWEALNWIKEIDMGR